jgi:large subunit ribosomal protein L9
MEIILLERVEKLGQMGQVVRVRDGYARNYLLPQGKALRATKSNRERFKNQRAELEATNLKRRQEAEAAAGGIEGRSVVVLRQAGESGQLYGSVSPRDVAAALAEDGVHVDRKQVLMDQPIKTLGLHIVRIGLHPEVAVPITVNVARSEDEAARQAGHGAPADEGEEETAADEVLEDEEAGFEA